MQDGAGPDAGIWAGWMAWGPGAWFWYVGPGRDGTQSLILVVHSRGGT